MQVGFRFFISAAGCGQFWGFRAHSFAVRGNGQASSTAFLRCFGEVGGGYQRRYQPCPEGRPRCIFHNFDANSNVAAATAARFMDTVFAPSAIFIFVEFTFAV